MVSPERIGRYSVVRRLGSGGFASVWLGRDDALGAQVAIKILADNWAHLPDIRQRFIGEAQLLRKADSDRVVRVYDIGELPGDQPYFVMAFADRGTAADRIADAPLPLDQALHIAAEAARAAEVLHRLGVIHRDIKPSNVLIQSTADSGERVMLADLGVAKPIASGFTNAAGTPGYMAPEQAIPGFGLDVRADVYGLGALTYHLITGRMYEDGTDAWPQAMRAELPKRLRTVVARALQNDRTRRWPTAESFATALAGCALVESTAAKPEPAAEEHDASPNTAPSTMPGISSRWHGRKKGLAVVAIMLSAALFAGGLIWEGQDQQHLSAAAPTRSASPTTDTTTPLAPSSSATTSKPPATSQPSLPPIGKLDLTFTVGPVSGFKVRASGVEDTYQWATLTNTALGIATEVSVYSPRAFDPASVLDGEPVTVAGWSGFYDSALPDPNTNDAPGQGTPKPAVALKYGTNAWFVVQTDNPISSARDAILRIAATVTFGIRRPLRFPIHLDYLPPSLRPCGGMDGLDPGFQSPWNAWIDLCDEIPGNGPPNNNLAAIQVSMTSERDSAPAPGGKTINGRPAETNANGISVNCGKYILYITTANNHEERYFPTEIEKILQATTVRSFDDKPNWFSGSATLP
jgi:serine/threonine protein kinase